MIIYNCLKAHKENIIVFGIISIISLFFCFAKYGYFIDEIFTLGCANSHYAPFFSMLNGGDVNNVVIDKSDFLNYLTVNNNEVFDFGSVLYNLKYDTQPPLYFLLLNTFSSLFQNVFSKWIGLALNYLLFWATLFFLYKICRLIDLNGKQSLIAVALFGLSNSLLSNLLNIRMYILYTLLSIVLVYLFVLARKTEKKLVYFFVTLVIFLGAMTQYLFIVFAFFICVSYIVFYFTQKKWFDALILSLASLLGIVLLIVAFPHVLDVIFSGGWSVSGGGMIDKLKSVSKWPMSIINGSRALITGTFVSFSLLIILILIIASKRKKGSKVLFQNNNKDIFLISISALFTFVLVSITSPSATNLNYIANIAFVVPLLTTYLLSKILLTNKHSLLSKSNYILNSVLVLIVISAFVIKPNYINGDFKNLDSTLSSYVDSPCIYYQSKGNNPPVSQDMVQLIKFNNVFITDGSNNKLACDYIYSHKNQDHLIVYVDATEKGNFNINDIVNYYTNVMNYSSCRLLYKYECSECYVFSNIQ